MGGCGCDCVCVCACICVCVGVGVIAFMRAQGSLDEWCMFVWCGWVDNYVG